MEEGWGQGELKVLANETLKQWTRWSRLEEKGRLDPRPEVSVGSKIR